MPQAEPLNFRLSGPEYEPRDERWRTAPPAVRLRYWTRVGEIAVAEYRHERRKGIDVFGAKLKPVKPESRPDGATGKPLVPHYGESRTARLIAAKPGPAGVTLFWRGHGRKSWATILGYHAYRHGPRSLPVRNVIGLSPRGLKTVAAAGRLVWETEGKRAEREETRRAKAVPTPPKPKPKAPQIEYVAKGAKVNHLSRKIKVYEVDGPSRPPPPPPTPPKPKPVAPPKPALPAHVITRDEVAEWVKDSVYQRELIHRTYPPARKDLYANGIDYDKCGGAFGKGWYASTEPETGFGPVEVRAVLNVRNPLVRSGPELVALQIEWKAQHCQVFREECLRRGYDAVVMQWPRDHGEVGRDWICVIDPQVCRFIAPEGGTP